MSAIDIRIGGNQPNDSDDSESPHKKFIGVRFECAEGAYARFYKNETKTAYTGRCPKCLKEVKVGIGAHGTSARFFAYDCGRSM